MGTVDKSKTRRLEILVGFAILFAPAMALAQPGGSSYGVVQCANLVYAADKTSVCFSAKFLEEINAKTNIATQNQFSKVYLGQDDLFEYPFAVMTGEGSFALTQKQRDNLRDYLRFGGFLVASAGCSDSAWADSFRREMGLVFPDTEMSKLELTDPIFHTVYDINNLDCKKSQGQAIIEGMKIDGRVVLVFSSDGLNDTKNAGGNCCCCGGNEIRNARQINVNLLVYALTH